VTAGKADVVVVGLGAAGGTAVQPLAEAGLQVVAIEAGPADSERDAGFDELRHQGYRHALGRWKASHEVPTHRLTSTAVAQRPTSYTAMDNAVGGPTNSWDCLWYRNTPWNFRQLSSTVARYGTEVVPADSTLADWPIAYEDVERYYDTVEYLHGVSGKAGNIRGVIDVGGNVYEGPRSREFPLPPCGGVGGPS
jgi:gluconate 2-dehydrogenase alpha chain